MNYKNFAQSSFVVKRGCFFCVRVFRNFGTPLYLRRGDAPRCHFLSKPKVNWLLHPPKVLQGNAGHKRPFRRKIIARAITF